MVCRFRFARLIRRIPGLVEPARLYHTAVDDKRRVARNPDAR